MADSLEVVECVQDDGVAPFDQTDGGQQLQNQSLGPTHNGLENI
jgi:hypothetical protein